MGIACKKSQFGITRLERHRCRDHFDGCFALGILILSVLRAFPTTGHSKELRTGSGVLMPARPAARTIRLWTKSIGTTSRISRSHGRGNSTISVIRIPKSRRSWSTASSISRSAPAAPSLRRMPEPARRCGHGDPPQDTREQRAARTYARGVAYWTDGTEERIVTITPGFRLVALNAKTGLPVPNFGINGTVDLFEALDLDFKGDITGRIGNSSPPVVSNGVVIVGPALTPEYPDAKQREGRRDGLRCSHRQEAVGLSYHSAQRRTRYDTWLNNPTNTPVTPASGARSPPTKSSGMCTSTSKTRPTIHTAGIVPGANLFSSLPRLSRYQDRQDDLVPPTGPPRHLGLRHAAAPDAAQHQCRWQTGQGGRPDRESRHSHTFLTAPTDSRYGRSRRLQFRKPMFRENGLRRHSPFHQSRRDSMCRG